MLPLPVLLLLALLSAKVLAEMMGPFAGAAVMVALLVLLCLRTHLPVPMLQASLRFRPKHNADTQAFVVAVQ